MYARSAGRWRGTREIIRLCAQDLSNSNGNTDIPLSSYGLFISDEENFRRLCAPDAPCLDFNKLFIPNVISGRDFDFLFRVAEECGFERKLNLLIRDTNLPRFAIRASFCQSDWEPTCIVEAACNGRNPNNSWQESLVNAD